jgi:uncharacterized protein YccT (UPF0319 family)
MHVVRRKIELIVAAAAIAAMPAFAIASETITYTYDAKGRAVKIVRTGSVNNGVNTSYTFDKADNRTNKNTTGSPNPGPP